MSEPFTRQGAPSRSVPAVIVAIGLAAGVSYLSGAAGGIGTSERDHVFTPADPPWSQSMLAALDDPFGVPPSASSLAARGAIAIAGGRRGAARDLAAVATAAAIAAFCAWLIAMGVPIFPAALASLAMAVSPMFWARGLAWHSETLSPAWALLAGWAWWRWLDTRRLRFTVTAGIALAALVAWPFMTRSIVARDMAWATLVGESPPSAWPLWAQSVLSIPASPGALLADLARELTPLGAGLAVIGTVTLLRARAHRTITAILVISFLLWYAVTPRSRFEPLAVPFALCAWAAIAVALRWLHDSGSPRIARPLVVAVGVLLIADPLLTRMRMTSLGKDLPSELRTRMASDFRIADLPADAAIVSESRRVDAAILLSSRRAGRPAMIVPQSPDRLIAVAATRELVAFENGRANLERVGFLFDRDWANATPIAILAGHVPCVDLERDSWPDVSLHAAAGSLSIHGGTPNHAPGGVVLQLTSTEPITVRAIEPRSIPYEITEAARDANAPGRLALDRVATRGGVTRVTTIRVPETGRSDPVTLTFDRVPTAAVATGEGPAAARLCAGVNRRPLTLGRAADASATIRMDDPEPFGPGWHSLEADADYFRWTGAPSASIRITAAQPTAVRVTITATPASRPAQQPSIDLTVNACRLPARPMRPGQGDYEWDVPEQCWRSGFNQIWIGTTPLVSPAALFGGHDTRLLGARIGAIRFARQ